MSRSPRILFAGGGTGGHVYPAIAIADAVRALEPEAAIAFAGTQDRMEWEAVPKAGYAIHPITVSGLQRSLSPQNLSFPFKLMKGLKQSWDLVGDFDADVVVGTGGYVSGPVLLAASWRGRPIVIQEQNAHAGLTNRLLSKRAEHIHIAFPEAKGPFPAEKCILSGNPTRKELQGVDQMKAREFFGVPANASMLFVFGGSLGSGAINDAMERHLPVLLEDESVHILWQSGTRYYDNLSARVMEHPRLRLQKYVDRMDLAYAATDVALCRAGA
ncbi:MAG: UDP-N-acetylglucosamine--N-acetylmuramyl-(pentapeptide) pyrophosphoryl-undecaprenol N-acetylglucosamine transferase, partial [Saprospiraceae bacterium]|nr:UDP-N-acetylglucosamine--N-acetylmuramyl-(pentapeptide) pyrophosphoryl-undecaprenol N-acetylglucosamine transferase [Saprospiraceae bacterium]